MLFPERPITIEHVRAFCGNFSEGLRIEYKATFDNNVRGRVAKIVSSFANSHGGVLVIGVNAPNGVPQPPFEGFTQAAREELRLTIENLCLKGIYPPLLPTTTVVPSDAPDRVFLVIEVEESGQAPHAIENSKTVYVRTGDSGNPYDLAKVDLIIDLVKRRSDPNQLRDKLLADARSRANDEGNLELPRIEISICPLYPRAALSAPADIRAFLHRIQFVQQPSMALLLPRDSLRRVPDGAASVSAHEQTRTRRYLELNKYGLLYASRPFGKRPWGYAGDPVQQLAFGDLLHALMKVTICAGWFYTEKFKGDVLVDVSLFSVQNQIMRFRDAVNPIFDQPIADEYRSQSETVEASRVVSTEDLGQRLAETLIDILGELTWAFWQGNEEQPIAALRAFVIDNLDRPRH
jgi:hypothetical protein